MTQILYGERIGRQGNIRLGCSAVLFDAAGKKVLLTRRADNGQWCLPSGGVEPGESVTEACSRETWEETGLKIHVNRLTSIFSSPDRLVIYPDGNRFQFIILNFEVHRVGGKLRLSDETTDVGFYSISDLENLDIFPHHKQFILDTLAGQDAAYLR